MSTGTLDLSIVIPCYNEDAVLTECNQRLSQVLTGMGISYECIYVDDGSRDRTWLALSNLHLEHPDTVVALALSRNFGHQVAVSAGLSVVRGRAICIIDADLQDPPEIIPKMYELWRAGSQVVYGVRTSREAESRFKIWSARLFYRLINRVADIEIPNDTGDFRLIDRRIVDVMLSMPERHRLLRGISSWIGFKQTPLPYERAARFAGTTKYPLRKMISLALDGIVSFSVVPLRLLTFAGAGAALLSLLGILYTLGVRLFTHEWVAGWATLFVGILFLSGLQMICLGVMGEYIGRIYTEVKQRPLFIIRDLLQEQPSMLPNNTGGLLIDPAIS